MKKYAILLLVLNIVFAQDVIVTGIEIIDCKIVAIDSSYIAIVTESVSAGDSYFTNSSDISINQRPNSQTSLRLELFSLISYARY